MHNVAILWICEVWKFSINEKLTFDMICRKIGSFNSNNKVIAPFATDSKTKKVYELKFLVFFDCKYKFRQIIEFRVRTKYFNRKAKGFWQIFFKVDGNDFLVNHAGNARAKIQMSMADRYNFFQREFNVEILFGLTLGHNKIGLLSRVLLIGKRISNLSESKFHLRNY